MSITEIERQIIGKLLIDGNVYLDNMSLFNAYEFYGIHRPIITEIKTAISGKGTVSSVAIAKKVSAHFDSTASAISYLSGCRAMVNLEESTEDQLLYLIETRNSNVLFKGFQQLALQAQNGDSADILKQRATDLFKGVESADKNEITPFIEHLTSVVNVVDRNRSGEKTPGIPTGLYPYDRFSGGMQLSDMEVIAGKSSMGKTAFALGRIRHVASLGIPVAVFNYEMSAEQLTARILSKPSGISAKDMLMFPLEDSNIHALNAAVGKIQDYQIYIPKLRGSSFLEFLRLARLMVLKYGVKYFVLDFLQRMRIGGNYRNQRTIEIGDIAKSVKDFAIEANVKVDLLSQLSRDDKSSFGKEPVLSDLRQSGEVEEAADIVTLIHRPEYYLKQDTPEEQVGRAKIIIAKGRNIGLTEFWCGFNSELTEFFNLEDYNHKRQVSSVKSIEPNWNF